MGDYEILLFDVYFCDLIVTGLPQVPRLGLDLFGTDMGIHAGGTFNTVRALHRLGLKVGWATDFGNDLFSQFVLSEVQREGVDQKLLRIHDRPVRFFSVAFSMKDDRGFISYADKVEPVERIPYLYEHRPKAILLNVLETGRRAQALVAAARDIGATVFLDSQSTPLTLESPSVVQMLGTVDVFLPNGAEAMGITGAPTAEEAGQILAEITPLVVVKQGSRGAQAWSGESLIHSPGLEVDVVDTTGAGDCFNGGFIAAYLRGQSLQSCLDLGNVCGGLSTTTHGTEATPTLKEALRFLQRANKERIS